MFNGTQRSPVPTYNQFFVESVYNLRPSVVKKVIRPPRYVSQYSSAVEAERQKPKRPTKTFGVPHLALPTPCEYLTQAKRDPLCPPHVPPRKKCYDLRRGVPQKDAWKPIPVRPISRDLVAKTKKEILQLRPKVPEQKCVDRRNGESFLIAPAGLAQKYVLKPTYGKVPAYVKKFERSALEKRKSELFAARGAELVASQSQFRWVSDQERECVLQKLQENFDLAMHDFQALSVSLDNQSKIKTKFALERKLNELEKTIATVKNLKHIVVKLDKDV